MTNKRKNSIFIKSRFDLLIPREDDLRDYIPVSYDSFFKSVLSSRHAVKVNFIIPPTFTQQGKVRASHLRGWGVGHRGSVFPRSQQNFPCVLLFPKSIFVDFGVPYSLKYQKHRFVPVFPALFSFVHLFSVIL